jgi:hypothetical protein
MAHLLNSFSTSSITHVINLTSTTVNITYDISHVFSGVITSIFMIGSKSTSSFSNFYNPILANSKKVHQNRQGEKIRLKSYFKLST